MSRHRVSAACPRAISLGNITGMRLSSHCAGMSKRDLVVVVVVVVAFAGDSRWTDDGWRQKGEMSGVSAYQWQRVALMVGGIASAVMCGSGIANDGITKMR